MEDEIILEKFGVTEMSKTILVWGLDIFFTEFPLAGIH